MTGKRLVGEMSRQEKRPIGETSYRGNVLSEKRKRPDTGATSGTIERRQLTKPDFIKYNNNNNNNNNNKHICIAPQNSNLRGAEYQVSKTKI